MSTIEEIAERARARRRVTQADIDQLTREKDQLLKRGVIILMTDDYEARDRWLGEYRSITRRIHENQAELKAAA